MDKVHPAVQAAEDAVTERAGLPIEERKSVAVTAIRAFLDYVEMNASDLEWLAEFTENVHAQIKVRKWAEVIRAVQGDSTNRGGR